MTARSARRVLLACSVAILAALAPSATAAGYDHDHDTVIVRWKAGVSLAERLALHERAGVERTLATIDEIGARLVRVSADPARVAARLDRSPLVEYAEPNGIVRVAATPNDARFGELYGLHNTGQTGGTVDADIDAPEGWDAAGLGGFPSTGGVKVAVVDTGVDATHEDLAGKVVACGASDLSYWKLARPVREGTCVDEHATGHGTHVSGTIAARANNGKGVAGVAFNSPLVVCKALHGPAGTGTDWDVAACIVWAHDQGARVISMSLGGSESEIQHSAISYAWENGGLRGSVLVAAAGNGGSYKQHWPASHPEVVSVAATDHHDHRAVFSNYHEDVEIAAPGYEVLSAAPAIGYRYASGTSMATPHVSGVAALIWGGNPGATAAQVRAKLDASVDDLGPAGRDPYFGFGRVNLLKAVTD